MEKKFAETPANYYEDYEGAIAKMKKKVEEIFFDPIDNSTEGYLSFARKEGSTKTHQQRSPWDDLNEKLVGTEASQNLISPWAEDRADPPPTYPIDEIENKLRESEVLIDILEEIKAMRKLAIKLAQKKKSEYEKEKLKVFNNDCEKFRDDLNSIKSTENHDNKLDFLEEKISKNIDFLKDDIDLQWKNLCGGIDDKWKILKDRGENLIKLSKNLGLHDKNDFKIFSLLKSSLVEDVKNGLIYKLYKFGDNIQKEDKKRNEVKVEDLETLKKGIKDQIKRIQILNIGKEELPLLQKYTDKIDKIIGRRQKMAIVRENSGNQG